MTRVVLYTTPYCGYCRAAKHLLGKKGVTFTEIDVSDDMERRREMIERAFGRRTVPQIFINDTHVGGYDELAELERAGKLDALLAEAARSRLLAAAVPGDMILAAANTFRAGLVQLRSGRAIAPNMEMAEALIRRAAKGGASMCRRPRTPRSWSSSPRLLSRDRDRGAFRAASAASGARPRAWHLAACRLARHQARPASASPTAPI